MTARLAIIALCLATARAAPAAEIEGVRFAERVPTPAGDLVLHNVGLLRYRIFIKAYVAALYLGEGVPATRLFEDVPKRLEIEYFYGIAARGFAKATDAGIAANVAPAELASLRPRIARLNTLYRDVRPDDRYALTYLPAVGTELARNGAPLGVIEGADFAAAVFAIWLGKDPLDDPLKAQLVGGR